MLVALKNENQAISNGACGGHDLVNLTNQYRGQLSKLDLTKITTSNDVIDAEILLEKTVIDIENTKKLLEIKSKIDKLLVTKVQLFKKYMEGRAKTEMMIIGQLAEILRIKNTIKAIESRLFGQAERDKNMTETKVSKFMSLANEY